MKIYIICLKDSGCSYPMSWCGKTGAFTSRKEAEETAKRIEKSDKEYCKERGGLCVFSLEGPSSLLDEAGFYW